VEGEFEVFSSGGGWKFLLGKLLLRRFQAVHDYHMDTVSIRSKDNMVVLHSNNTLAPEGSNLESGVEQQDNSIGGSSGVNPPSRQVLHTDALNLLVQNDESSFITDLVEDIVEEVHEDIVEDNGIGQVEEYRTEEMGHDEMQAMEHEEREQRDEQGTNQGGGDTPPSREVQNYNPTSEETKVTDNSHIAVSEYVIDVLEDVRLAENDSACQTKLPEMEQGDPSGGNAEPPSRGVPIRPIEHHETALADTPCLVLPVANSTEALPEEVIFTCHTDPFLQARIAKILELVQIGDDVTDTQRDKVKQLIAEFADCFTLSLTEVNLIPGAVHKLNIPENTAFRTKVPQRSFNRDQRSFMAAKVQEMLKAGVVCPMHPSEVRCVAPSILAHKTHGNTSLSSDELKHKVNDKCVKHGLPTAFDLPPCPPPTDDTPITMQPKKWRLCQDFGEINKVMAIAPVPQGDVCAKQLRLSGHRYIHIFDFAAGFYGIAIHPDSQPYIVFHLEGHGYFSYERMPFGITGGPSEFGHTVGQRMHDLVTDGTCETFVDDGGSAADSFEEGIAKLRCILERVRKEKLSLSPGKLQIFMTEAVFVGARIGPGGVSPDSSKLTAVVNWRIPEDASHLEGFLGLTVYFRDLVKGYAALEKPLRDLLCGVDIPSGTKKGAYQRIMKAYKLQPHWKDEHTATFISLKRG